MPTLHIPTLPLATLNLPSPERPPLARPGSTEATDGAEPVRRARPGSAAPTTSALTLAGQPHGPTPARPKTAGPRVSQGGQRLAPQARADIAALVQRLSDEFDPAVRAAGWSERYDRSNGYAPKFWRAVLVETGLFRTWTAAHFVELLRGMARQRRAIATAAHDGMAHRFGEERDRHASDGLMTPIGGVYAQDRSVRAFLPRFLAGDARGLEDHILDESYGEKPCWVIVAKLPSGALAELTTWESVGETPRWWHATPTPEVMAHLETVFHDAWNHPAHDAPGVLRKVARLQWWMAHACIFARGSAGISDMVAASVLWHHGMKRPRPQPETSIDLAALSCPSEAAFMDGYASLFEQAPVPFGARTARDAQTLQGVYGP